MQKYETLQSRRFHSKNSEKYFYKALNWAIKNYTYVFCFNGERYEKGFIPSIFASNKILPFNEINELTEFRATKYNAAFFSYDLKNQIEKHEGYNVVIAPLNTKLSALGAAL